MFEHLDDPQPLAVGDATRRVVGATAERIRMRRRLLGVGTTSVLTLVIGLVAIRAIDGKSTSRVTASAAERPSASQEETRSEANTSPPTEAPTTTGAAKTAKPATTTTSTTSAVVMTTTTAVVTHQVVKRCHDAELDRPSLLFAHFLQKRDGSSWEFNEVRELVVRAGGSTAHLDRVGEHEWASSTRGEASMAGGRAELEQVAERLAGMARDGGWVLDTQLRCASEDPNGRFAPDRFTVLVREGVDVEALLTRHERVETEEDRRVASNGKSTFVRLKTSRPTQLFERVLEWWNDPDVLYVEYSYSGGGPAG